jgi:uncharacterized protein (TIGR02266 family)
VDRKKILLVDDVELFLMLEKTFFSREEFELITARSGNEALKTIREAKPDLVFMDLYMPEMNGDECCRIVKADDKCRHIPIVMVTQGGREEDLGRCRRAGCDEVVLKPINRHDFMATTRKYLQIQERANQRFKARLRVSYRDPSEKVHTDFSIDISPGGLFLATDHPLPIDCQISVEFILPTTGDTYRRMARVAWVNNPALRRKTQIPPGMGVQLLDISPVEMDAILDYIKKENLDPAE